MNLSHMTASAFRAVSFVTLCFVAPVFAQVDWTLRNPSSPAANLNTLAVAGTLVVAAGDSGALSTSTDGLAWTARTSGTTNALRGATGNNNLIVAVGNGGTIRTATPGNPGTWSTRTSGTSNHLHGVAYSGNLYVAVGAAGSLVTSTNGTGTWTLYNAGTTRILHSVEFGNNLFVAVGDSGTLLTATTATSTPWTSRSTGTTQALRRVRFANNLYLAVGDSGKIFTSTNGTSWTARTSGTTASLSGVQRGTNLWVAVGDSGRILTSTDGTTWTLRTSGTTAALRDVAWTGSEFLAAGVAGMLLASTDGITWVRATSHTGNLSGVLWNGSLFVAPGAAGTVLTSTNGTSWTPRATGSTELLNSVDSGGGTLVAVGNNGTVLTSTNGTTWTARSSGTTQSLYFVRRGGGRFVAVGAAGTVLVSTNGISWTGSSSGITTGLYAVEWTGTQFVAVGAGGTVLASPDGNYWSPRTSGIATTLYALRWTGTHLVAAGAGGTILLSQNGASWEATPTGTTQSLFGLAWQGNALVAVGNSGTILTSPNGVTWASQTSGTSSALYGVGWGNSLYVAVGPNGVVLTAPQGSLPMAPGIPSLLSPTQNETGVSQNGLAWQGTGGGGGGGPSTTYRVQLSTSPTFTSLVKTDSNLTATSYTGGPYQTNTTYYWRVNARQNGYTSHWSEVFSFSTGTLPAAPVLSSPAANATAVPLSTTLQWGTVTGALAYRVQLSASPSFATILFDDSTLSGTSRAIAGLSANTVYYWRVRAQNTTGSGVWSTARAFTTIATPPAAPTLTSPAQNATGVSVYSSFTWNASTGATGYRAQIASDSAFTTIVRHDSTLIGTTWTPATLPGSSVLYWRVQASNPVGSGAWSSVRKLTTAAAPTGVPAAPTLVAPAQFATNVATTATFQWNALTTASAYRIQISTQPDFSALVVDDSALSEAQKLSVSLAGSTPHYWRVNGRNSFGSGPWSEPWTFTTAVVVPTVAPTLLTPLAFATDVAMPPVLTWGAVTGATTYRVQVSTTTDFATLAFENTGVSGTTVTAAGLAGNTDYYWRVAARNTAGTGPYSSVRRMSTGAVSLPGVPVLLAPAAGSGSILPASSLSWEIVPVATSYRVQVAPVSDFTALTLDDSLVVTTSRSISVTLQSGKEYWWRVRSKNATGVSAWSTPWNFIAVTATALRPPSVVTLSRLSGAVGLIRFGLPERAHVTLRLRDANGRLLATLLDETREAGYHGVALPGAGESSLRVLEFRAGAIRKTLLIVP